MACTKRSPVTFNIKFIGGETTTISADQSEALSSAVYAHGLLPKQNDHFIFYHRNSLISPYFSIGTLDIEEGDTLFVIEPKENKKQKSNRPLTSSKSTLNLPLFLHDTMSSPPLNFADDFYLFSSGSNPCFQTHYPTKTTIIPKPPRAMSRDPLPMYFPHEPSENDDFWTNLHNNVIER